jgi:hypothetical protein
MDSKTEQIFANWISEMPPEIVAYLEENDATIHIHTREFKKDGYERSIQTRVTRNLRLDFPIEGNEFAVKR